MVAVVRLEIGRPVPMALPARLAHLASLVSLARLVPEVHPARMALRESLESLVPVARPAVVARLDAAAAAEPTEKMVCPESLDARERLAGLVPPASLVPRAHEATVVRPVAVVRMAGPVAVVGPVLVARLVLWVPLATMDRAVCRAHLAPLVALASEARPASVESVVRRDRQATVVPKEGLVSHPSESVPSVGKLTADCLDRKHSLSPKWSTILSVGEEVDSYQFTFSANCHSAQHVSDLFCPNRRPSIHLVLSANVSKLP